MEVFVRNFPDQTTEKQVNNFFRKVLEKLGIHIYYCEKLKGRGCARLTILDVGKARQFLKTHGQTEPGLRGFAKVPQKLEHMGRPINCSLSNNAPDPLLLQSLKKEQSDRDAVSHSQKPKIVSRKANIPTNAEENRRAFNISQLKCGQWTYEGNDLAFTTYYQERRRGRVLFGTRALLIKLASLPPDTPSHQVEIPYNSVESFTVGPKSSASMTFLLREAPKFFESLITTTANNGNNLEDLLQNLGFQSQKQGFKRKRIVALSKSHEAVVSSCMCYRVLLDSADVARVTALKRFPEIPISISWNTSDIMSIPFAAEMTRLNTALTGATYGSLPFELKFQMQKLAQNGVLGPSKVVELLGVVARHFDKNKDAATVVQSVRNLYDQIPFPGPGTEASDLSLATLSERLVQNQESILREHSYSTGLADRYDHITSVHKATVTPTGIYLYGPDDEVKNRVLRKYSAFPNHFLSVAFLDEDGETLRLDRQTSGEDIYWQRYKKVLEGVINIAGRGYEVR